MPITYGVCMYVHSCHIAQKQIGHTDRELRKVLVAQQSPEQNLCKGF